MTGYKLNTRIAGQGRPILLFVHGYTCAMQDWEPQIAALRHRFECVALDLPGHGGSAAPDEASVATMAEAVIQVKNAQTGPVILVGHSLGSKVVREAYARSPGMIAGLVLIDGGFYAEDPQALQKAGRDRIDRDGYASFARAHFEALFGTAVDSPFRRHVVNRAVALDPRVGRDLYLSAVGFDFARGEETLAAIRVPVLVLQSSWIDADGIRRPMREDTETAFMERVRRLVPQSRIVRIPDSSHFPMQDQSETVNREILQFGGSVDGNIHLDN